ncbi:hypothetical protein NUW58_g57 [Xylaria curta]|uniref:Uncharacterized protein n=1 Tax=Xylaria curta TaxID=42375 RepID=A0ACC1PSA6_9PEZI|nr:hypothetical protein NUW58_g57 [Xylaria curta]
MFANQRNLNSENFTSLHKRTRWTTLKTTVDPKDSPNTLRLSTESSTQIKAPQSSDAIHPGQDKPALQISLQAPSTCRLCHRELNIRFTCIDCSVNFCFTCRMLHFTGHTIVEEAVTNNVSVRDDISLRNNISVGDDVGDPESGNTNPNKNDNKFDDIKDMLPVTWRKDFERMMEEVMTRAATKAAIKAAPKILKRLGRRSEDQCQLPIITLPFVGFTIYAVFSVPIIQSIQKQHKAFAFQPIQARFSVKLCGASKDAYKILQRDMNQEDGEYGAIFSAMHRALNPGGLLNEMNIVSADRVREAINDIRSGTKIKLDEWLRHQVTLATTDAVYGPHNPFQDKKVQNAFWAFERAIPSLIFLPKWLAPQGVRNRKVVADAFQRYFLSGYHENASALVKDFYAAECSYGFSQSDRSLFEVGNAIAILANTYAAVFWLVFYVFSDSKALQRVRNEVSNIISTIVEGVDGTQTPRHILDMTKVNSHCPFLVSTFRETIRLHSFGISLREVCKDTVLDNTYCLKQGATIIMPTISIHTDPRIWGPDALSFKYDRFLSIGDAIGIRNEKVSPAAFRSFGGGTTLCPGRHFATTQIMVWISMLVMRFDLEPISGRPDHDIEVKFTPRCRYKDGIWDVRVATSEAIPSVTVEDLTRKPVLNAVAFEMAKAISDVRLYFDLYPRYDFEKVAGQGGSGIALCFRDKEANPTEFPRFIVKATHIGDGRETIAEATWLEVCPGHALSEEGVLTTVQRLRWAEHIVTPIKLNIDPLQYPRRENNRPIPFNKPYLIVEYLENGTLMDFLSRRRGANLGRLPNRVLWAFFLCLTRACVAMANPAPPIPNPNTPKDKRREALPHSPIPRPAGNLVHGDMNLGNLMFGDRPHRLISQQQQQWDAEHGSIPILKLIDFGEAYEATSPEVLPQNMAYDRKLNLEARMQHDLQQLQLMRGSPVDGRDQISSVGIDKNILEIGIIPINVHLSKIEHFILTRSCLKPQVMGRLVTNDFTNPRERVLRELMIELANDIAAVQNPNLDSDLFWLTARCLACNSNLRPRLSQLLDILNYYIKNKAYQGRAEESNMDIDSMIEKFIYDVDVGVASDNPIVLS